MTTCFGKSCSLTRFTVRVLRERLSVGVCASFPFDFEMWDSIVLIPDHCLLFTLD